MKEVSGDVRKIDSRVFSELTEEAAICMLGVAHDLRSGVIPPENFQMARFHCGTAHCICGWIEHRLGKNKESFITPNNISYYGINRPPERLCELFSGGQQNDVIKAADAVENYLFNYAEKPWGEMSAVESVEIL